jgi:hypothetical protein
LGLFVDQTVDLAGSEGSERRAAAVGAVERGFQLRTKQLEIDHRLEPFQRVTNRRQRAQPLFGIKEARLSRHRRPLRAEVSESLHQARRQWFFEVSVWP